MGGHFDLPPPAQVFNIIYINELLIKWLGMGWKQYFGVPFNTLDFGIVCASLLQYGFSGLEGAGAARMLRVLRLFRAARLLRVLRKYDSVMALLQTVLGSISEKDVRLAQKLGQLQSSISFIAVFPHEWTGQLASSGPT